MWSKKSDNSVQWKAVVPIYLNRNRANAQFALQSPVLSECSLVMHELKEKNVFCPYCGERISVLLDPSVPHQNYI
jgi:DNA-directed RNA polymerase subunit RPC12/RpoP